MRVPFLSMFMRAIGLFAIGSVFAFVTTWGTIFRMCPVGSSGCSQTVGDQVAIIFTSLMIYAVAGLGLMYLLLAAACKAKTKFAKETGLATQYVSAVLGLMSIIGVTSSVVSTITRFRSTLIHSATSLDITDNFVYNAQVHCSHRTGSDNDGALAGTACDLVAAVEQFLNGGLREQAWGRIKSAIEKQVGKGLSQKKDCKQPEYAFVLDRDNAHENYYNLKCTLAIAETDVDGYFQNEHVVQTLEDYQITSQRREMPLWKNIPFLQLFSMHALVYVTCLTLFRISAEALGVVDK